MGTIELLKPILDGGIRSVNFFNGRLLTGEDLSDEQRANRDAQRRLGQAAGEGVAYGLEVAAPLDDPSRAVVTVQPGLAINRLGQSMTLASIVELSLVRPAARTSATGSARFGDCVPTQPGVFVAAGQGVYLLLLSPSETSEGRAPTSGLGNVEATCSTRYTVAGVQFRLIALTALNAELADLTRLRNRVAYRCFGVEQTLALETNPFGPASERYGLLDELRPNTLTPCDVPLAVISWTTAGVEFVDQWAVRRRVVDPTVAGRWHPLLSERRLAEAEAMALQFQAQLDEVELSARAALAATSRFRFLPPAGYLPINGNNFRWQTFLGSLAPPAETLVDAGLLRELLLRSLNMAPIALDQTPRVVVDVYRSPAQPNVVVFSRSVQGRLRVTLHPGPANNQAARIYVSGYVGTRLRVARDENPITVVDVPAGTYTVRALVPGFHRKRIKDVSVRGGQITELQIPMEALTKGSIRLFVVDQATNALLVQPNTGLRATATLGATSTSGFGIAGRFMVFTDLAPGTYTITVDANGYQTGTLNATVAAGQSVDARIGLTRQADETKAPPRCITLDTGRMVMVVRFQTRLCMVPKGIDFQPNLSDLTRAEAPPREVTQWLLAWRSYLAQEFGDRIDAAAEPVLFYNPRNIQSGAYAVFGGQQQVAVPLLVNTPENRNPLPVPLRPDRLVGIGMRTIDALDRYEIYTVDQLAGASPPLVSKATGQSLEYSRSLVEDARRAAREINTTRSYYEGVDGAVLEALNELSLTDDVALANADRSALAEKLGSPGFATRLVEQARQLVPREAWSLEPLGLTTEQISVLEEQGVRSKGELSSKVATDAGRDALVSSLGADAAFVTSLRATATSQLTTSSVALAPSKALDALAGVNAVVAEKLAAANVTTVDALATAKADELAQATGLSEAATSNLIAQAAESARTHLAVSKLAPVTNAAATTLKTLGVNTVADLASKNAAEIDSAFGGDVRVAAAVIEGAKLALRGRSR